MKFLNPSQCRAARGLLNWSQPDLATRCGLHIQTISSFEQEVGSPSKITLQKITEAFEKSGIEILDDGGVKPSTNKILVLRGEDGFATFFENVYETARGKEEPNICVVNANDRLFLEWHSTHAPEYIHKMEGLDIKPARSLLKRGDNFKVTDKYSLYRWLDQEIASEASLYLYGKKAAIIDFKTDDVEITVISNVSTTKMLRAMFEIMWEKASNTI